MLSMFSKKAEAEKSIDSSRLGFSTRKPASSGNVTPLKLSQAHLAANAENARPAVPFAPPPQRAKVFENVPSVGQYLYHLTSDIRVSTPETKCIGTPE